MSKRIRYWEVDLVRSLAVIGMVTYHLFFDLFYLRFPTLDPFSLPLILLARLTAFVFLFLVGFSFSLSLDKYLDHDPNPFLPAAGRFFFITNLKRAVRILFAASLVTLATFIVSPEFTVRFGILHLVAFSLLLLPIFIPLHNRLWLLPLTLALFTSGFVTKPVPESFDYFPIFPWFGVVLLGFILAKDYSTKRPSLFAQTPKGLLPLTLMGQHSLSIYLLHQPVLFGILFLLKS